MPGFLRNNVDRYPDIFNFRLLHLRVICLTSPDYIQYVLQKNYKNYEKGLGFDELRLVIGDGILTSHGESWLANRRLMQPAFHRKTVRNMAGRIVECTENLAKEWEEAEGPVIDVHHAMLTLALNIICKTTMGIYLSGDIQKVDASMEYLVRALWERAAGAVKLPLWVPTPQNTGIRKYLKQLDEIVWKVIRERRKQQEQPDDLMGILLNSQDVETGKKLSDEELRDELITILLAGHETSANALSFAWYMIATHPEVEQKFHEELEKVLNGRAPGFNDLEKLTYTTQIIRETLRMYPPIYAAGRKAIDEDEIDGHRIPKGVFVHIPIYGMHYCERYWENPDQFDPERFTEAKMKERDKFVYLPFGAGPRTCIGNHLAMMEMQLALATLGQQFRLRARDQYPLRLDPVMSLRPKGGLWMELRRR